jgi:hypothetical protein
LKLRGQIPLLTRSVPRLNPEPSTFLHQRVTILFPIACAWSRFGTRLVPIENSRSGALNRRS